MICPHCSQNLLRKERVGNTCSKCRRGFVTDPRTNSLGLSDVRILRISDRLTGGGRLVVSVHQLWAAARRNRTSASRGRGGKGIGCLTLIGLGVAGAGAAGGEPGVLICGVLVLAFAALRALLANRRGGSPSHAASLTDFHRSVMSRWAAVHGSLPAGVMDERAFRIVPRPDGAERPNAVVFCKDMGILAVLAANGIPERYRVALAARIEQVPDKSPVVVLHDADADGCLLTPQLRAALPGRKVVDAGLSPRTVMNVRGARPERLPKPAAGDIRRLRGTGTLTDAELRWVAKGRSFFLVGAPPARLMAAVTGAIENVTGEADSDRRGAEAVGFLTWPGGGV
jgi:hypothetical protein